MLPVPLIVQDADKSVLLALGTLQIAINVLHLLMGTLGGARNRDLMMMMKETKIWHSFLAPLLIVLLLAMLPLTTITRCKGITTMMTIRTDAIANPNVNTTAMEMEYATLRPEPALTAPLGLPLLLALLRDTLQEAILRVCHAIK